jgi:processive 1,2-diacylglycerol beta-glucosyltransferase
MKVLILSISTGQGHHATGQAIEAEFQNMGVICKTLDAYEYIEPILSELVSKGYLLSTAYAKRLSSKVYDIVVKKNKPVNKYSVPKITNTVWARDLRHYIDEYEPDVIICTHVLSATLVNIMKEKNWIKALTVGIVTDFTVHPLWEECRLIDYYVTPSELLEFQIARKGLEPGKMLPLGIPIKPKFSDRMDRMEARKLLGLDLYKRTILLMSGSMGYGKIDESIEKLDSLDIDFQVIVVCGNNKRMYQKVSELQTRKRFDIYGYVDNVDIMMDAADCIITKPGGITSSEAMAKGLPMIMINPIPGHEMRNAEFMLNNGLALYATKSFPLNEAVFSLFKHPDRISYLRGTIELYGRQHSSQNLCKFLVKEVQERGIALVEEAETES